MAGETGKQVDLFLDSIVHAPIKDDRALMEFPFFSIQKQPKRTPITYDDGNVSIRISPGERGIATIWDKDVLIYAVSPDAILHRPWSGAGAGAGAGARKCAAKKRPEIVTVNRIFVNTGFYQLLGYSMSIEFFMRVSMQTIEKSLVPGAAREMSGTMPPWKASSHRSRQSARPAKFTKQGMRPEQMCSTTSNDSTIRDGGIRRWAI